MDSEHFNILYQWMLANLLIIIWNLASLKKYHSWRIILTDFNWACRLLVPNGRCFLLFLNKLTRFFLQPYSLPYKTRIFENVSMVIFSWSQSVKNILFRFDINLIHSLLAFASLWRISLKWIMKLISEAVKFQIFFKARIMLANFTVND